MRIRDEDLHEINELLKRRSNPGSTHYGGCHTEHIDCAARYLLRAVEHLRTELELHDGNV